MAARLQPSSLAFLLHTYIGRLSLYIAIDISFIILLLHYEALIFHYFNICTFQLAVIGFLFISTMMITFHYLIDFYIAYFL